MRRLRLSSFTKMKIATIYRFIFGHSVHIETKHVDFVVKIENYSFRHNE